MPLFQWEATPRASQTYATSGGKHFNQLGILDLKQLKKTVAQPQDDTGQFHEIGDSLICNPTFLNFELQQTFQFSDQKVFKCI